MPSLCPPSTTAPIYPDIGTPLPGLYWVSMSQVYPWDRGTNYAIELARRAAALMQAAPSPIMATTNDEAQ